MRASRVLSNIQRGAASIGVCLHITDPTVWELTSLMGFDAIWLDLEHHGHSIETAAALMRAARVGGTDVVARPGKGEFGQMARLLEAGASGIMYPRCSSAAEAAEVVRWAKFAPLGQRGFDGSGADVPFMLTSMTDYLRNANDNTFVIIQVEEEAALEQADEILAVPGVDMLMLGPADYSVLSGFPGEFQHPRVRAAIERVATAARKAGKSWAATCGSLQIASQYIEMGARLLFHGCDIVYVKQGLDQLKSSLASELGMQLAERSVGQRSYLEIP